MYDEVELAGLSYRNLQILAAQHRVPGNIKKHTMIKVIVAARKGDDTEVTRLLNELQQTRKKRVKKIKKERKIPMKTASIRSANYRENRYYAHQQKTFRCASNLQIAAEEELTNAVGDHTSISNCEDFHEYLVRVQRDYHFNFNNNIERIGSPSIVDLRMNEQKTIVHQSLPLDLHRATNILLSSDHNYQNNADRIAYNFFNANDAIQTPLLLKKMLQAPAGTNLKDIAGPDGVYRIFSQNEFAINNFVDDSDTLSAESGSNHNDDIDNTDDNYEYTLNAGENQFINIDQSFIDDNGIQQLNSMSQHFLNDNDPYRIVHQSNDVQQNFPKFVQASSTILKSNDMPNAEQDNAEIFKNMYYSNQNSSQDRINNMQTNQVHYQVNNYPITANNHDNNHSNCIESSNSSHCNTYNYPNETNIAVNMNHDIHHNYDDIHYNNQIRSSETCDYYSQSGNAHDPGIFTEIYSNVDALSSQQFNNSDGNIDNVTELNNSNVINNERCGNNGYNYDHDIYPINSQINFNVTHDNHGPMPADQHQQHKKYREFYNMGMNQTTHDNGDLEPYFPHWKQSTMTSTVSVNLENLLNIRKHHESSQTKNDDTSSVFCYSPPIVTPQQLNSNANVCTQEKRFFVENRSNLSLRTNSSQVYNDTAQGLRMANPINDLDINSMNKSEIMNNNQFLANNRNFGPNDPNDIGSDDQLRAAWAIDYSNIRCDVETTVTE